jgi:hypothetical protein
MSYKIIPSGYFVTWITCLMADYESKIVTSLIKKGYAISSHAIDSTTVFGSQENPCTLLVFRLYNGKEGVIAASVHKDILEIFQVEKMYVYSTVVSEMTDCSWAGPNILLPAKPKSLPPPVPVSDKKLN